MLAMSALCLIQDAQADECAQWRRPTPWPSFYVTNQRFEGCAEQVISSVDDQEPSELWPLFSSQIQPQISLCKKKILITSKYRHMHGVLNVDEI
jgi:hypothetical protein